MTAHATKEDREKCFNSGMSDYLSKPIKHNDLFSIIDKHFGIKADDEAPENLGEISIHLLDIESFLNRICDGNKDLAYRMIDIFLKNYIKQNSAIKKAIDDKDPEALNRSAHSFKGSLVYFCKIGSDLVGKLEDMGHSGIIDMEKANGIYDNLKSIVDQIVPKLAEFKRRFEGKNF
jgi:CheY-like chemotaxis protein